MTTTTTIKSLFANDINRRIEEVIKVDSTDEEIISDEIKEYVVTDAIRSHYTNIFDAYRETPNKPHEGVAIWVSGFFGSGKSSFAKMLGLSVANRMIEGEYAADRFAQRTNDSKLKVLLKAINEKIPTHAVIFDVSTDRGIRSGSQMLTEIIYRLFLESLGYAKDLDLSELEITLEESGELSRFEETYRSLFNKDWAVEKGKLAFSLNQASQVLHKMRPETYPLADSWVKAVKNKADITPAKLAERSTELMRRRKPGHSLMFVVDEVGQFVARDVQKMLDLQAIVQSLGVKGRGKHWVVVTSQEKLGELVSGLDDKKIELARLMDRFPLQVHLEPSDISEVTSRRVLTKNAPAQKALGELYDAHRGRFTEHTRLTADIKLPEISRDSFIELYPLIPYQIDLIIQVVSGLRTQGGASKHVGGANRTIIKLAQQLLINPSVKLAESSIGQLVRLDHVYDLVDGNIGGEVRAKITAIAKEVSHPLAQSVAKVICLLQYVKSVHRSAENIAAALHPNVLADSQLAGVREALRALESAQKVRLGDDGYRIPTPAEDDWERLRNGINPKPGDCHRIYSEILAAFWQPQPSYTLFDTKPFKAGLSIHGREATGGDIDFNVYLAEEGEEFDSLAAEHRTRSQQERKNVYWVVPLSDAIDRETVELFRSKEMLARKERETKGEDTPALIAEERVRQRRHNDELRRLLRIASLSGRIFFRGNDRSPGEKSVDVGKTASEVLSQVLPDVFERFKEAAAKAAEVKKGTDALFTADNLQGLPAVFGTLGLLRDEKGKAVFKVESSPLKDVLDRIDERASYGDTASGRYLSDEFAKEPFGWDFEVVRLLVLSLIRAGKIEATSKGQTIDSVTGIEARDSFSNNNIFRQASFRPKKGIEFGEVVKAAEAFRETFGSEVRELTSSAVVAEVRKEVARFEDTVVSSLAILTTNRLPGGMVLENAIGQMKGILRGSDDNAINTFNASYRSIKDAVKRAIELEQLLTEPSLRDLERARVAKDVLWAFLERETNIQEDLRTKAGALADMLARETFFKDLSSIEQHSTVIESEYERQFNEAIEERISEYTGALNKLVSAPGWKEVAEPSRRKLAEPFERWMIRESERLPIPQIRADRDACESRLRQALGELRRTIDGDRVVMVNMGSYFASGIETEEQLDAALNGVRDECARLIGAGKKIIVQ